MDAVSYKTTKGESEAEYIIQKSRFITHTKHVETEEEAREFIAALKKKYFDARHNPSAYVIGENQAKQKSNDDGEPGGTAGNPILEAIKANELTNIVIVVTRYFGGIKLGAGGLIRAYNHSAVLGIESAEKIAMLPFISTLLIMDYNLLSPVENYLRQKELTTESSDYGEKVTLSILLPPESADAITKELTDLTAGKITIEPGEKLIRPQPLKNT